MSSELSSGGSDPARCSKVMVQQLEHVLSLVGPAREEIAHLKEQLARVQGPSSSTVSADIEDLKRQNEDIRQENMKLQQKLNETDNQDSNYREMSTELQKEKMKTRDLEVSVKTLKENEVKMKADNKETKAVYMEVNHELEKRFRAALKEVEDLKCIRQQRELAFESENRKTQQDIAKLSSSLKSEKIEKENMKKDLSDTKSRLSKLMGDKLSDNNPDIADLSDNNRPTKLAEKHQELYDNQWTDAYEITEKGFPAETEESRIKILLQTLMGVYKFCKEENAQQEKDFLQAIYRADKMDKQDFAFPSALKSQFKELRRHAADDVIVNITEKYLKNCDKTTKASRVKEEVKDFVHECMTLCWFMVSQDPPLVFLTNVQKGDAFDSSKYKQYTVTGTTIEFVVWPALLLHKDGSVLSKGIVQCERLLQGSKSVKARSQEVKASVMGIPTGSLYLSGNETPVSTTSWSTGSSSNEGDNNIALYSVKPKDNTSRQNENRLNAKSSKSTDQKASTPTKHGNGIQLLATQTEGFEKQQPCVSQQNHHITGKQNQTQATTYNLQNQHAVGSYQGNQNTVDNQQQNEVNNLPNKLVGSNCLRNQYVADTNPQNQVTTGSTQSNQSTGGNYHGNQATTGNSQSNQPSVWSFQGHQHTSSKNLQNQATTGSSQINQFAGGSNKGNQHAAGTNKENQVTHGNNQQMQPADRSYHDIHNNSNQALLATLPNAESNKQNSMKYTQASNTTDLGVYQQQSQTNIPQYPAYLVPTERELDLFVKYNNYYCSHHNGYQIARYYLGVEIYDKCWNYQRWLQSYQY